MCDLKGRDCIEKNSWKSFDCNTTCVGIYADVQFVEKNMKDKLKVKKAKETSESDFKVKFDEGSAMFLNSLRSLEQVSYGYDTSNFVDINKKLNEGSTMLLKRLLFNDANNSNPKRQIKILCMFVNQIKLYLLESLLQIKVI